MLKPMKNVPIANKETMIEIPFKLTSFYFPNPMFERMILRDE